MQSAHAGAISCAREPVHVCTNVCARASVCACECLCVRGDRLGVRSRADKVARARTAGGAGLRPVERVDSPRVVDAKGERVYDVAHVVSLRVEGLELVDELALRRLERLARRDVEVASHLVHLKRTHVRRGEKGVRGERREGRKAPALAPRPDDRV
eukprot:3822264-Pleurochrysis_carterae.AAC.1